MKKTKKNSSLRSGYTTGACAAAAAKAAITTLLSKKTVTSVFIFLPIKKKILFKIHSCIFKSRSAECSVIKYAGDDPDVTNGIEIKARVEETLLTDNNLIIIKGGEGVGKVTKEGLPVKIGMAAINPVPMKMIRESVSDVIKKYTYVNNKSAFKVTIIVPHGKTAAKKTLNRRLGIINGISILGTTGIVEPMSLSAYKAVIETCFNIAIAAGCGKIVLTPGRMSQKCAEKHIPLQEEAYIQVGDHIGHSLKLAQINKLKKVIIVGQLGKFSKIANGKFDTHAYRSKIDFKKTAEWAHELSYNKNHTNYILKSNTMAQVSEYMKKHNGNSFFNKVCEKVCYSINLFLHKNFPKEKAPKLHAILLSPDGNVIGDYHSS